MLLRKSNIAGFETGSSEGQRQKWCVPAGEGTPARQVCPHRLTQTHRLTPGSRRHSRCVPTAGFFKGDCRHWVAPAVGSGIWRDRASFVAEKQRHSREGWFAPWTAANVDSPHGRVPTRRMAPADGPSGCHPGECRPGECRPLAGFATSSGRKLTLSSNSLLSSKDLCGMNDVSCSPHSLSFFTACRTGSCS